MLIQKIIGGLGNQMFQYAFVRALSLRNKVDFKLDIHNYNYYFRPYELEIFNIEKKYAVNNEIPFYENIYFKNKYLNLTYNIFRYRFISKLNKNHYIEPKKNWFRFNSEYLSIKNGYIEGYFQTEKYFKDFENEIRKDFTFVIESNDKNKEIIKIIDDCNSISLHIRRGDYITSKFNNTLPLDYYKKAIEIINSKIQKPIFFIFSDSINWVKENLKIENAYYIDWNNADTNYEDMKLMSLCKHNIIANSSFSWWGAWLNNNKDKIVIAPSKWIYNYTGYLEIVPNGWIKI